MSVSLDNIIRTIIRTGKVVLGSKRSIKLVKLGKAKAIVIASNVPSNIRSDIEYYAKLSHIPIVEYPGTNMELGAICGKPFSVAVLTVLDLGSVPIESLLMFAKR
ncbi:MAG: 50S ribosomal protein L30e [Thermoprotei archaeon]|nr:MAG: 50S ribosomal protein L30e [Thermoprotei archaeon]